MNLIAYAIALLYGFTTIASKSVLLKAVVLLPLLIWQAYNLSKNGKKYSAAFSAATVLLSTMILLGGIWDKYISFANILMFVIGVLLSIIVGVIYFLFLFATVKKEKEIVLKRQEPPKTFKQHMVEFKQKIEGIKNFLRNVKGKRAEGKSFLMALHYATVEEIQKSRPVEKNAMDFTLIREVKHERNEQPTD